jgi:hypothetical protein
MLALGRRLLTAIFLIHCCFDLAAAPGPVTRVYTVPTLPAASGMTGQLTWVTDASSTSLGATCSGGGTNLVACKSDGTNWTVALSSSGGTAGSAPYSKAFVNQTSVTLVHGFNTMNVITDCYDDRSPSHRISADISRVNANTVQVDFFAAQSGSCVVNGGIGPSGSSAFYSQTFSSQTSVVLSHNYNTTSVVTACYNSATPPQQILGSVAITDANHVTVTFSSLQSGYCVVNSSAGSVPGVATSLQLNNGTQQPACSAGTRGTFWFTPGSAGTSDHLAVCSKNDADVYSWVGIF